MKSSGGKGSSLLSRPMPAMVPLEKWERDWAVWKVVVASEAGRWRRKQRISLEVREKVERARVWAFALGWWGWLDFWIGRGEWMGGRELTGRQLRFRRRFLVRCALGGRRRFRRDGLRRDGRG